MLTIRCKDVRTLMFEIETEGPNTANKMEQIISMVVFPLSQDQPIAGLFCFESRTKVRRKKTI